MEEIDDKIVELMIEFGPDGHCDGHEKITEYIAHLLTQERSKVLEELRSKVETLPRFSPDSHGFANDNPHGAFVEIEDIKQALNNLSKESR